MRKIPSIASTYNEPLIAFEFVRDISIEAKKHNIKMVVVDNGYITKNLAEKIAPYLDAANIDIKGFTSDFYKEVCDTPAWKAVLETCKIFKESGVHIEITNLVIPSRNDSRGMIETMCQWISSNLGPDTPLHFSAFHPDHLMQNLPRTPLKTLEMAYGIAKQFELEYVYLGNVISVLGNDTRCPECNNLIIKRHRYNTEIIGISNSGTCTKCQKAVPIVLE
jgi:pyruvate formate lyase activating enzyme